MRSRSVTAAGLFAAGAASLYLPQAAEAQVIGQYAVPSTAASAVFVAPSNVTAGLTFSNLTRGGGLTATGNAGTFTSFGFNSATADAANTGNDYLEFTVGPNSGFRYSLSSFTYTDSATSPGPANISVRSSADGFAGDITTYTTTTQGTDRVVTLGGPAFSNLTSSLTFRIIGFNANNANSGSNYALQTNPLTVNGAVTAIAPEPGSLALLLPIMGTVGMVIRRRRK